MIRFLLTLLVGAVLGAAAMWYVLVGPAGMHDAVGHWQGGLFDLRIESDGSGSMNGFALDWSVVDPDTVSLRYTEKGDPMQVRFELDGPDRGMLRVPLFATTLTRVTDG